MMSGAVAEDVPATPPPRPPRGRHQLTRSISEFSPPMTQRLEGGKLDKRVHRHHHHHRHSRHESNGARRDQLRDDSIPSSAGGLLHGGRSSVDFTRSESLTPSFTPDVSRTGSVMAIGPEEINMLVNSAAQAAAARNTEEQLREEKEKAASRITGLKKSVLDLATVSNATTQRLDETLYAVLEKTSVLQSTVTAMRELAAASRDVLSTFEKETTDLEREVQSQLETFGQFDGHEKKIQEMQARIQAGREKIEKLSARVDVVKNRIEGWERADLEWQERTRKRLKRAWIVTSVVVAVVLFFFLGARWASYSNGKGLHALDSPPSPSEAKPGEETNGSSTAVDELGSWLWNGTHVEQQDNLRFLDEL